jgi:hypothetical protein
MTFRPIYLGAAVLLTLLTGCGGSDGASSTAGAVSTSLNPGATTASADATPVVTASASGQADCDAASTVQEHVKDSHITKITVDGGCSQVSIETTLTSGANGTARKICDSAAEVAYVGNLSSVTVVGPDGHELAAGQKGMGSCIGQP